MCICFVCLLPIEKVHIKIKVKLEILIFDGGKLFHAKVILRKGNLENKTV